MIVTNVKTALAMEDDQQVLCFAGILANVYNHEAKTKSNGDEYTLQTIIVKDGNDQIKVSLFDQAPIPKGQKGQKIYIQCSKGVKGWNGIKIHAYTPKKGPSEIQLSVSAVAVVGFGDVRNMDSQEASSQVPEMPDPRMMQPRVEQPTMQPPAQPGLAALNQHVAGRQSEAAPGVDVEANKKAVHNMRLALGKMVNTVQLCFAAGEKVMANYKEKFREPMQPAQFQALISTFFISIDRQHLIDNMPTGDMSKYLLPTKNKPKTENEPVTATE